jgi:hypothetical protein
MRVSTETATAGIVGLLENIEKRLVLRLMKSSGKQPFLLVFIIVFLSMNKKGKKKVEPEKDENYWRVLGGL